MIVLSLPFASERCTAASPTVQLIASWCDPVAINVLGLAAASVLVYFGLCPDTGDVKDVRKLERLICCGVVILLVFVFSLLVSLFFMVPFSRGRSPRGPEVWLTAVLLGWSPVFTSSFSLLLQFFLLDVGLIYSRLLRHKKHQRAGIRELRRSEVGCLFLLLVSPFLIASARYLRGTGTWFDFGISLGLSTFFFWVAFFVSAKLFRRIHPGATGGLVSMTMLNIPIFVCLSRDLTRWSAVFIVVMFFLGLMKVFVRPALRLPEPNLNQEPLILPTDHPSSGVTAQSTPPTPSSGELQVTAK
jgi:hypothetical protein